MVLGWVFILQNTVVTWSGDRPGCRFLLVVQLINSAEKNTYNSVIMYHYFLPIHIIIIITIDNNTNYYCHVLASLAGFQTGSEQARFYRGAINAIHQGNA